MLPNNTGPRQSAGRYFVHCSAPTPHSQDSIRLAVLVVSIMGILEVGCVHRRLTIRSNPAGALVYVDNHEIGTTPVSNSFTYYGTREIRLEKDGYETLTVRQNFTPPWYQIPCLDFVSENLVGQSIRDERALDFRLVPQAVVPTEQLLRRADNLRRSAQSGVVAPLPTISAQSAAGPTRLSTPAVEGRGQSCR